MSKYMLVDVKMKSKNRLEVVLNFTAASTKTEVLSMFKLNLLEYTVLHVDTR